MKNIILFLSMFSPLFLTAQNTFTWKGGTPGKETAWNEARNWDINRVPSEDDVVNISFENNGHFSQPIIDSEVHVAWVKIGEGASLVINEAGQLTVDGEYTYSEGVSMFGGSLMVEGGLILKDIDMVFVADINHQLEKYSKNVSAIYGSKPAAVVSR